jgi:peptide/nickel transport system substrate-binding protein
MAMADLRAAALAAALALGACSTISSTAPHAAPTPKILRIVGAQEIDNLNTLLSNEQVAVDCAMFWAGFLYNIDDRGNLYPELATQVPTVANGGVSPDGLTITYHLRKGVTWQDGAPFTARDVRFTWQAIMNPDNNVASRTGYDLIRDVEIVDDHTVRVHLLSRYAPAVDTFFAPGAEPFAILPAHLLAKYHDLNRVPYNVKPVGTGPFVVDSWEQGVGVTMHANPKYWRGRPKLDGVRFLTVHDSNTMLIMMRTGEADLYYRVPDSQLPEITGIAGTHVLVKPFVGYFMLLFNTREPPLDELAVRRAISYGIDKRRVLADVTHGTGDVATGDQPPWLWADDPGVPQYSADAAAARRLLDADGWSVGADGVRVRNGRRLSISISAMTGFDDGMRFEGMFQQWMREIGVEVVVNNYPSDLLYATFGGGGILASGKFDTAFMDWYNGIDPDDSTQWECADIPPAGQNFAHWCDPSYDAAEATALSTYDVAARKRAYAAAQQEMAREVPADFLFFIGRTDLVSDRLTGYRQSPAVSTFWNTWEYDLR